MKKRIIYAALCAFAFPLLAYASVPQAGVFVGLGGSYNSVKIDENINLIGVSNVYSGSTLVAYGNAIGPAVPFHPTQTTFAPLGQVGYFRQFSTNNNWLWGVKLFYTYLGLTVTDSDLVSPQSGLLTNTDVTPFDTFTGRATIQSIQTSINQQWNLLPFIGHALQNGFIYFGIGPALFSTQTKIYDVTGFADVGGVHLDVTGNPTNFSSTNWMWGAAAQVGITYYLEPTWSVDGSYTFAITQNDTTNYRGTFSSVSGDYRTTGNLIGSTKQQVTAQAVAVSINKFFDV